VRTFAETSDRCRGGPVPSCERRRHTTTNSEKLKASARSADAVCMRRLRMSRVLVALLVVPVLAACNAYAAREGQSISSLQGNADDDQIEYGPSDLSAQSDASMAAVAALVALLDGGPDAVTPKGLSAIEPSLTYVKGVSKRPGQVSVISASNAVGIAVMSQSGTCFWLRYSVGDGVQTFGAGSPCTGRAALGAASEAW
jgi:hypothetical protein